MPKKKKAQPKPKTKIRVKPRAKTVPQVEKLKTQLTKLKKAELACRRAEAESKKLKAPAPPAVAKGRPKKGGSRYDAKEFYKQGAPAKTNQIPDPAMRYTVDGGRREKIKYAKGHEHDIIIS